MLPFFRHITPEAGCPGSLNTNSQTPRSSKLIYLKYGETIMSVAKEFEAANAKYVASFTKGDLQLPPQRCVDDAHSNSDFDPGPLQKTQSDSISERQPWWLAWMRASVRIFHILRNISDG